MPLSLDTTAHEKAAMVSTGTGFVLLVEDEKPLVDLLAHLIGRLNMRVLVATDGASALELFSAHRGAVSLAFVDCNLPDIPGPELCERMREMAPALPLLLTSGRNQDALEKHFAGSGPCEFLPKPYLPTEVLRRVTALLATTS